MRSRAGGKPAKPHRRKTGTHKSRITSKTRPRGSSVAREETEVARLASERDEAFQRQRVTADENARLLNELRRRTADLTESLEQQTATSEVLQVISSSPSDLEPVFAAMLEKAVRICEAKFGSVYRCEAGTFHFVANHNVPPALDEQARRSAFRPSAQHYFGDMIATRAVVQVTDLMGEQGYIDRRPEYVTSVELGGVRTYLMVPMLQESELIGAFIMGRQEVRSFTDRQIELVKTFAAQAVIALENARLLNELRQRTTDLAEALEQQTGTSDVLRVISSSPGELEPVFQAMLENATRLSGAKFSILMLAEGDAFRLGAAHNAPQPFAEFMQRGPVRPSPQITFGRAIATKRVAQTADITKEAPYLQGEPLAVAAAELGGYRTVLAVPMLKESNVIGALVFFRQEVRVFDDKQIALVQNFASQAVIAIENARLLNELRQRTNELAESLEQQTATAEVLKVISSSPGHLEPVFAAILENATRICGAKLGSLNLCEAERFRVVAMHGIEPGLKAKLQNKLLRLAPNSALGRLSRTKKISYIPDVKAEPDFFETPARFDEPYLAVEAGARTLLAVPMLKENELIGGILIYREEVQPFTEKQKGLVASFAAQAVIAIENARLLNELRQRTDDLSKALEQQTATSDVLRVISNSPANIQPVLETIGGQAEKLCDAEVSVVSTVDGELINLASIHGMTEAGVEAVRRAYPARLSDETVVARAVRTGNICHVADVLNDSQYQQKDAARVAGFRGCLGMPMVRENRVIGAIFVARRQPGLFSGAQVQLLKTFADQAAIAIENVRLFEAEQQRTRELTESLERQTATSKVLDVISRSA
jgi:GAF domain-containing protein